MESCSLTLTDVRLIGLLKACHNDICGFKRNVEKSNGRFMFEKWSITNVFVETVQMLTITVILNLKTKMSMMKTTK